MKLGVIILARANFGRWPDKVLYKLEGITILEHVIIKAKKLNVDTVIVSTTGSQEDQVIRNIAWDAGAEISRGEPDDRTARYYTAIQDFKLDYFMSIAPCAPFFDSEFTSKLISAFIENPEYDYYRLGGHTKSHVTWISRASLIDTRLKQTGRDQEIFMDPRRDAKVFSLYNWWDSEVKNKYLYDANIAYKIQADNHRRICEHLGHFPESYDEIIKALLTIE